MWLIIIATLAALCLYTVRRIKSHNAYWKYLEAIPGPTRHPFVGAVELLTKTKADKLFLYNRELNRRFPEIYSVIVLNESYVAFTNPEDIELITSNMKHITKSSIYNLLHTWISTGLLTSTGEKWQKRRKILTSAFHFSILQEFVAIFNRETDQLVRKLEDSCSADYIDVLGPITDFTLSSIGETSLGGNFKEVPRNDEYGKALADFIYEKHYQLLKPWLYPQWVFANFSKIGARNKKSIATMHDFSTNVIRERQQAFKNDASYAGKKKLAMLDLLLKAKMEEGNIDDEGIREEVDTFMFEGHDTVAMAICYVLVTLANHQNYQEEVYQEMIDVLGADGKVPEYNDLVQLSFTERCIKESLRLYPSVPFIGRVSGETFLTKDGFTVPVGTNLYIHVFDLHRNPRIWPDPEKFDPDRFLPDNVAQRHPFAYIPFSAGPRNCIGQKYAILEIKSVLCGILRRFKLEPIIKTEELRFKTDLVLRPAGELRVKFVPRSNPK